MYTIKRCSRTIKEYVNAVDDFDLLLNRAMREFIPETLLDVYEISKNNDPPFTIIIAPKPFMRELFAKTELNPDLSVSMSDDEFEALDYTRFLGNQYTYIGYAADDVVLNIYKSTINETQMDAPILRLLKKVLSNTTHIIDETDAEKHKSSLTQIYSRIRKMETTTDNKKDIRNQMMLCMSLLEQFAERVEMIAYVRDDVGKLIPIKERIF